jgi:hypothetical protein
MEPRKIQIRALRGSDSEQWRGWHGMPYAHWRWIWLCPQCHISFPCGDWETAMTWVDLHLQARHKRDVNT